MKKKACIIIDLATIYPGKGGAGGGIWTYASQLVTELDRYADRWADSFDITVVVNKEARIQKLNKLKIRRIAMDLSFFPNRLFYVHIWLPVYCWCTKSILHKTYFEVPLFSVKNTIVTIHDCMASFYRENYRKSSVNRGLKGMYFRWITWWAVRRSKIVCTPSHAVKKELVTRYGICPDKVRVTPLGVAVVNIERRKHVNDRQQIFCVSAFHRHKNHQRLLDIFEQLVLLGINASLHLRGHISDKKFFQDILEKKQKMKSAERVFFEPYDPNAYLSSIYAEADWMMLLSAYEGFGLPVIEAQAFGVPVICSDIPVFREVAGGAAIYIDEQKEPAVIAEDIFSVLSDPEKREDLSIKGKANSMRYTWERFIDNMISVYFELSE